MKKMIYVARRNERSCDIHEVGTPEFDLYTARVHVHYDAGHLTENEKHYVSYDISGYSVETESDDATATWYAYSDKCLEEDGWLPDPDYFEEVEPE